MSSGTKPLSLLDRVQSRRSAVYLSVGRTSCASHAAAEEYVCICSLSFIHSRMSAVSRSNSERLCVTRTPRDQSASHEHIPTVVALGVGCHAADVSETNSGGLAIHSRVQSLGNSVSGDSSGFRGSAFTARLEEEEEVDAVLTR